MFSGRGRDIPGPLEGETLNQLNRTFDEHPDTATDGGELRDCGPLDGSDLSPRLAKQYPQVSLERETAGIEKGENLGQPSDHKMESGPLDATYRQQEWGKDHKRGNGATTGQGLRDDWIKRRAGVDAGEESARKRAHVTKHA
jgi:hypothetical protein